MPSNHAAQLNRLVDDLVSGRTHDTTLTSTRPTMEFVTALHADLPKTTISEAFSP